MQAVNGVDILVNNAGIYGPQDFYETDDATWENYWQTNVMSGVRLSRALLPAMVQNGWGRVVFISSESARNIPADMIHYGVTKTAQLSLARGLAKFVAGSGVTVNSVLPGPTISDGFAEMMKDEVAKTGKSLEQLAKEFVMANRPGSVIQRAATVEEVANMVVYVCSTQASATSGAAAAAWMAAWWMTSSDKTWPARRLAVGRFRWLFNAGHFVLAFRIHGVHRFLQLRQSKLKRSDLFT